jgi:hypothetical protein
MTSLSFGGEVIRKYAAFDMRKPIFGQKNSGYAIIDTGSNFNFIPKKEFNHLLTLLNK